MKVKNKIALITGGGQGIGEGIALSLARNGSHIVITDLTSQNTATIQDKISKIGRQVMSFSMDVTNQSSIDNVVQKTVDSFGRIDILINNAGVFGGPQWHERENWNESDWNEVFAINVRGLSRVTESVSAHMKDRKYGKIVNIASGAARKGTQLNPPYAASKAAVINLTQSFSLKLAPDNINVNAICPGHLWTPLWEKIAHKRIQEPDNANFSSPRQFFDQKIISTIPLNREQTPEDIGNLACFLASDYAKNITGQTINVNGGAHMS